LAEDRTLAVLFQHPDDLLRADVQLGEVTAK